MLYIYILSGNTWFFGGVKRLGRGGKISMLLLIVLFDLCKMFFVSFFYLLNILNMLKRVVLKDSGQHNLLIVL